jgi:hypothetical protein
MPFLPPIFTNTKKVATEEVPKAAEEVVCSLGQKLPLTVNYDSVLPWPVQHASIPQAL